MNRREALVAASALFGGSIIGANAFLSGCTPPRREGKPFAGLLSDREISLLDEVAETILPDSESSPGAKAAKVGEFMNVIVTDCYSPEEQNVFRTGLQTLEAAAVERYGRKFGDLSREERHSFLLTLEEEVRAQRGSRPRQNTGRHYYTMLKQLSVWCYFSSEIGTTKALRYEAVPGRYDGCVPYTEGQKAWA